MSSFPFAAKKKAINWADEDSSGDDDGDSTSPDVPDAPDSDEEAGAAGAESEEEPGSDDEPDSSDDEPDDAPEPAPSVDEPDKPKPPPVVQLTKKERKALKAKELDDKYGGAPMQCRVVQGKEPAHFRQLFQGKLIVHAGGKASSFKNTQEQDTVDDDGVGLAALRGVDRGDEHEADAKDPRPLRRGRRDDSRSSHRAPGGRTAAGCTCRTAGA